jgi:hypothetical protein
LTIPIDVALDCMDDDSFIRGLGNGSGGFNRSLPRMQDLQRNPDLARFLKDVLASGKSIDKLESNISLDRCYKMGWLQAELFADETGWQAELLADEKRVYIFPSKLHER